MTITEKDVVQAYAAARNLTKLGRYVSPYRMLRMRTKLPRETVNLAIVKAFNQGYIKSDLPDIQKGYVTEKGKELIKG